MPVPCEKCVCLYLALVPTFCRQVPLPRLRPPARAQSGSG